MQGELAGAGVEHRPFGGDRLDDGEPERALVESRQPLDVQDGDTILFGKYSGQEIKIDGEEYLIMREDEVLAVLETAEKKK